MMLRDCSIESIVVLRALQLGDMLCSVPALRALRAAYPRAHIALVGLPNAADFVRRFSAYVDELLPFPGLTAFPEQTSRETELPAFYGAVRKRRFDLALQLHGSGAQSNGVVRQFGARLEAGFVPDPGQGVPGWHMEWPTDLPEPLRYLALLRHLGLPAENAALELPLFPGEDLAARALLDTEGLNPDRTVLVHPGARLPSRRWPADRFASVISALAKEGWEVGLTGAADEFGIVDDVLHQCSVPAANLCGSTTLGELAALLTRVRLLISNDTGVSHVAAARGACSLIVACGSDTRRWAPLDRRRHHVLSVDLPCRPCMHRRCPIGHPCALGVTVEQVLAHARRALQTSESPPLRAGSGGEYARPASSASTLLSGSTSWGSASGAR